VPANDPPPVRKGMAAFLVATAALCGALIMVVEVLGSRVIGPYFGVSLFVWTALISVTLLSLAGGYALGGRLADRHPSPDWLYAIIMISGVLVALIPVAKGPVIMATTHLGLRSGALVSTLLLFGPPLLLLGCVSPFVVRVAASNWERLGATVGMFYAVSTAGSFVGTASAGFFVIAYVGVSNALYLSGALLFALGAAYFAVFRARPWAVAALLPFALAFFDADERPVARLPDGTTAALVDSGDSHYGNVKVVDYTGNGGRTREMMIDGLIQGGIDRDTGQSIYEYAYLMEHLPLAVNPSARSALFIGLGPGAVVRGYQQRGVDSDVVDIDPLVVRMAEKHFRFQAARPVIVEDGRAVLRERKARYDIILMDVFNGDITPGHLLSREAMALVKDRLNPNGVYAMNLIASFSADSKVLGAIVKTLRTQFSDVVAFPLFDPSAPGHPGGNMVILAANVPLDQALSVRSIPDVHPLARDGVGVALKHARRIQERADAVVLTDDFNPLDVFDPGLHESVRRTILDTTPAAILLHG
jgi:spermidine synthase